MSTMFTTGYLNEAQSVRLAGIMEVSSNVERISDSCARIVQNFCVSYRHFRRAGAFIQTVQMFFAQSVLQLIDVTLQFHYLSSRIAVTVFQHFRCAGKSERNFKRRNEIKTRIVSENFYGNTRRTMLKRGPRNGAETIWIDGYRF